jgi:hypothetical protein
MIISKNPEKKNTNKTQPSCSQRSVTHRAGIVLVLLLLGSALATIVQSAQQQQQYALALPHAVKTITPDEENANPITVVLGHSNEPTFGVKPGVHDGKHTVEVFLEDAATLLPLSGSELTVDKFYFKDIKRFEKASSLEQADAKEKNVPLTEVFGEAGHYIARQIQQPGIYGYRLFGTINYFDVATVPIDTTVFCSISGEQEEDDATTKFNSEGWVGSYECTENIKDIFFPPYTGKINKQVDSLRKNTS